jgi:DNA repair exonuclease SbcCD ATPase subunit
MTPEALIETVREALNHADRLRDFSYADAMDALDALAAELETLRKKHAKLTAQFGEFFGGAGDIIEQRDKAEAELERVKAERDAARAFAKKSTMRRARADVNLGTALAALEEIASMRSDKGTYDVIFHNGEWLPLFRIIAVRALSEIKGERE